MEKSLTSYLEERFALPETDLKQYSPLTLAYIGDAVYELAVRTILVRRTNMQVNKLHKKASGAVRAEAQSRMIGYLEPLLTEEEQQIYHRGRNANAHTHAKNAGIQEYRRATGFEAVMGYLYLKGDIGRMTELIKRGLEDDGQEL